VCDLGIHIRLFEPWTVSARWSADAAEYHWTVDNVSGDGCSYCEEHCATGVASTLESAQRAALLAYEGELCAEMARLDVLFLRWKRMNEGVVLTVIEGGK
jgi:hypothetical protein